MCFIVKKHRTFEDRSSALQHALVPPVSHVWFHSLYSGNWVILLDLPTGTHTSCESFCSCLFFLLVFIQRTLAPRCYKNTSIKLALLFSGFDLSRLLDRRGFNVLPQKTSTLRGFWLVYKWSFSIPGPSSRVIVEWSPTCPVMRAEPGWRLLPGSVYLYMV